MGHSRIFQISTVEIDEGEFINECTFFDTSFIGEVADYVDDETDREKDISRFLSVLEQNGVPFTYDNEEKSIIFKEGAIEAYFAPDFEGFKALVAECDLEDFASSDFVYQLKKLIEDKFYYYFYDEDIGYPETFSEFMRGVAEGEKYYFGATIDYHY